MGLYSNPRRDGSHLADVQVDWPYYLTTPTGRPSQRRYYQHHNQNGAKDAAETFEVMLHEKRFDYVVESCIVHNPLRMTNDGLSPNYECHYVVLLPGHPDYPG